MGNLKKFKKILSGAVVVTIALSSFLIPLRAGADTYFTSFSVTPVTGSDDELIGNSSASWQFAFNNTDSTPLTTEDKIKITFPHIQGGRPFDLPDVTASSTDISVSSSIEVEGDNHNVVVVTIESPQGTAGPFAITLNGVSNAAAALSEVENLTWVAEAFDNSDNSLGDSITADCSLVRLGEMIPYNPDFYFSASSYDTSTSAKYTLSFQAPTALSAGDKIIWQFPSAIDLSNATTTSDLDDLTKNNTGTEPAVSSLEVVETGTMNNLVRFPISSGSSDANDIITVSVDNIVNPSSADVYRGFGIYTATSDNGVIDGLPMEAGMEPDRMGPPLLESIMIGGTNSITFTVKKEADGTVSNLSSSEADLVKVGLACPDKMFFVGQKYVDRDTSQAAYEGLLDCNYIAFTEPAQMPQPGQEVDEDFKDFFESYLVPAQKEAPVSGGDSISANLTFLIPDTYIKGSVTGGVPNSQDVELMAFSGSHMSWAPVVKSEGDYTFDNMGLDSNGTGYFKVKVASGDSWQLNLELLGEGGVMINSTTSDEYWPPDLGTTYIEDEDTTEVDLGSNAFVKADKDLTVNLTDTDGSSIADACVEVRRAGFGFMMGPGEADCSSPYEFKVPKGSLSIEIMQPGRGKPKSFSVYMKASESSKTKNIVLEAPTSYIEGTVTDSDGNVIANAGIFAHSSMGVFGEDMTDSSGSYKIYVPEGTYTVEGFAPGFGNLTRQTGITVSSSTNPTVNFTVNTSDFKSIKGRVYTDSNSNGSYDSGTDTPYEGVQIFGYGSSGSNGTVTLSDGSYTLRVPAGTYTVKGWSQVTGDLEAKTGVDVSAGNVTGEDWTVAELETLQIKVENASTISPIFAEAIAPTSGRRNHTDAWVVSGNDKVGTIQVLGDATYEVIVGSPGFGIIGSQLSVDPSGAGDDVTFSLPSMAALTGTVTSSGSSIEDAVVWASRIGGPGHFSTTTDSSGNYSMNLPTDRNYDVSVNIGGYLSPVTTVSNFSSGDTADFSLTEAGATITGTITSDGSTAIQEGWVWAEKTTGSGWNASPTNDDGTYSLDVDDGTWKVFADGPCYEKSSGVSASADSSGNDITLTAVSGCTPPTPKVQTITPSTGGTAYNDSDGDGSPDIEISFPANALGTGSTPVTVSIKKRDNPVSTLSNTPLPNAMQEVTITNSSGSLVTSLNSKATVTIHYNESDLPEGFDESELQFTQWNSATNNWDPVATTVDTDNNKITAKVDHFSEVGGGLGSVPSAPGGVSASASGNTITVSWNEVTNAASYKIYRAASSSGTYSSVGTTTSTSYSDSGLSYSTAYYYKVSAVNDSGEGSKSSSVSATTDSSSGGGGGIILAEEECGDYETAAKCENEGCYWYEDACHEQAEQSEEETGEEEESEEELELPSWEKPFSQMTKEEVLEAINEIQALIEKLQSELMELIGLTGRMSEIPSAFIFENALRPGARGEGVLYLQMILNSDPDTQLAENGPGSPGNETSYFGPLTKNAVIRFQEKYKEKVLSPWGLEKGTGFVGRTTIKKLNELLGR